MTAKAVQVSDLEEENSLRFLDTSALNLTKSRKKEEARTSSGAEVIVK
jgi:hypothetical protein